MGPIVRLLWYVCADWRAEDPARDVHQQARLSDDEAVRRHDVPHRPAAGHRQAGPGHGRRGHQPAVTSQRRQTHAQSPARHQATREC